MTRASRIRLCAILLACVAAFAGCSSKPAREAIEVRMRYSKFLPTSISVSAGTTVDFTLVNQDPIAHEFVIGTAAEHLEHEKRDPSDPHTGRGQASIPAEGTTRLTYTFTEPGTLIYACHVPGHYAYGMKGSVKVG